MIDEGFVEDRAGLGLGRPEMFRAGLGYLAHDQPD